MKTRILNYISKQEAQGYPKGIPNEVPLRLEQLNKAPSYKAIVKAIMKNDNHLETLGYSKPKCNAYNVIKRQELIERGVIKINPQLKFKL